MNELKKRVISAFLIGPLIVLFFYFLPPLPFLALLAIISVLALWELTGLTNVRFRILAVFFAMSILVPLYAQSGSVVAAWILITLCAYTLFRIILGDGRREGAGGDLIKGVVLILTGIFFIVLPFYYLYLLKEMGDFHALILLFSIWASDTGAYALGKSIGKHKLVPTISPNKTYEGLLGAVIGSMIIFLVAHQYLGMTLTESSIAGFITGILGQTGDILESAGKRACNVKDSSSLIPGHGGILDRMDSFIFTAPFLYYYCISLRI